MNVTMSLMGAPMPAIVTVSRVPTIGVMSCTVGGMRMNSASVIAPNATSTCCTTAALISPRMSWEAREYRRRSASTTLPLGDAMGARSRGFA